MPSSKQLRQERAELVSQMHVLSASKNPADISRWKELDATQENLRQQIVTAEQSSLDTEMNRVDRSSLPSVGTDPNDYVAGAAEQRALTPAEQCLRSAEYRRSFRSYLSTGDRAELRTYTPLGSVSPADGSTLVPVGFQKEVETFLKAIGGLRQCARVVTTPTGNPLQWPTEQDTSNSGTWLPQNTQVNQTNPTFSNVTLGSDLLSSDQVLVPVELFQDSAFNIETLLSESFGTRLARGTANAYMNGNGYNIVGLLPALVAAGGRSVTVVGANANSGNSGDTDLTSLGTDDWANLIEALDPAYRLGDKVGFLANQQTFDKMRNVKDKYGRPIWDVSLAVGQPDKILGYPYWYDQSMQLIGASNVPVIFGNFAKYVIRDVLGMTLVRYSELYMPNHQIGFEAFLRTFGQLLNAQAFAYLKHPSS